MTSTPLYLPAGREPILAFLHEAQGESRDPAVLLLGPFGWDDIGSYRPRRDWADHLASRGHVTLRLDLPGAGDSAGTPTDPGRVDAWLRAVGAAAAWLRVRSGSGRLALVGIGLGGLLGARALADGAPVEELVLWGVSSRGSAFVREMRAFARLEAAEAGGSESPQDLLVAGGFVLTPETVSSLAALDLLNDALPARRALLLGRDEMNVDARLSAHLEACGAEVSVAPGPGWTGMMAPEPQDARAPVTVIAHVDDWLRATPAANRSSTRATILDNVELAEVRETPVTFGRLFGVLAEPDESPVAPLTAVLLNAGAQRHIGPNRMWVEASRRWAARGVPTLRLDLEGLGDADGDAGNYARVSGLYVPELVDQVRMALDELAARGLPDAFALGGLCSGAYWAFHAAVQDARVTSVLMLNPRLLFWHDDWETVRDAGRVRKVWSGGTWRKLARREISAAKLRSTGAAVGRLALHAPIRARRRRRAAVDPLPAALDVLRARGVTGLLAFSEDEPFHRELAGGQGLAHLSTLPGLHVARLPGAVHTLRPLAAQAAAHDALDAALERGLGESSRFNPELANAD